MNAAEAMKFAVSGGVAGFHSDKNVFKAPEWDLGKDKGLEI